MKVSHHNPTEAQSNAVREMAGRTEPRCLRTFTPSLAVISKSAGIFHWTPEGHRLYDFSSGVLVANLGHNPTAWTRRFRDYLGWSVSIPEGDYFPAAPMTAYNALTSLEVTAGDRLLQLVQATPGGQRLAQVLWAASGSEAVQKALWACQGRDRARDLILATRYGFHGKKGLAGAVTGTERDPERDSRVRFIGFPMTECCDLDCRDQPFDPEPYRRELHDLYAQYGRRIGTLVTEPYLGGGGSYHPPPSYLHLLQQFCREHDILFILDEVQSNFGRTSELFAFQTYGLEPDFVVLGKGLGNGVPVAAVVGRRDVFAEMAYGEGSDTWSANPLSCAAVLATLDEFAARDVLANRLAASSVMEEGLTRMKELPIIAHVRGERCGMVWGVETCDYAGRTAADWANAIVLECYCGDGGDGVHLLGPLAQKVVRVSPPLVITQEQAAAGMALMARCTERICHGL